MDASSTDESSALRSNWKFPAVVHFCRVFEGVLSLRQFSSDKFEAALLNPGDHSVFLSELISRLLYPGRKKNTINPVTWPTWETNLLKKVKANWNLTMDHDPLEGQQHFVEVPSSEKLEILYLLTEIALLNSAPLRETIRNTVEDPYLTADSVRCLPIGEDAQGDKYFLFSLRYEDCRLYKQILSKESSNGGDMGPPEMVTLTTTLDELQNFVMELKKTKNPAEKKLHRYLEGILPEFERTERHRKRVEERAAIREQAPLLKRSSRLQEQAKRKEKARGQKTKEPEFTKNEDFMGEDGGGSLDLGISRAERMRLRNQRRELAEKGLRRVLTGKKRKLEYDGLTPLGSSVQCQRKKRIQNVRPSRNITKLVSIIWEKFRRPMHHRKQFEIHLQNAKNRRINFQGRHEFMARLNLPQKPEAPVVMRDARLPQETYRPAYVGNPSLLMNLQQQRPVRPNYSFAAFQMPRPLQSANEMAVRQTPNPLLQSQFARFPSSVSNLAMNYAIRHRPPALSDTLRRQTVVQQSRQYEMEKGYGSLIPNRQMDPGRIRPDWREFNRGQILVPTYGQRMTDGAAIRAMPLYSQDMMRSASQQNGPPIYAHALRAARPHLVPNALARSLVHFPPSLQSAMKANGYPISAGNNGGDRAKAAFNPAYLPQNQFVVRNRSEMNGGNLQPLQFDERTRWQTNPQIPDNGNRSSQDPNQTFHSIFLRRQRNN